MTESRIGATEEPAGGIVLVKRAMEYRNQLAKDAGILIRRDVSV